ncbi:MAG TPA: M15 family metallopeptidase [Dongiaceae bacterium]|nr:M15 family metallopeptidase [Dongiaceae bacterium]
MGGAARLARHGSEFGGAWLSEYYPQDSFSTDERVSETEFIRQADFYKFRGRGVIQTTGRGGYAPFVRFVQGYSGTDAALLERQRRWSALSADDAASASTNDDWEAIFASPDTLARALAFHAGRASTDYRIMSRDAAVLADVPAPPSGRRRPAGRKGSVFYMGRRISGSYPYGAGEYRDRVFTLLGGIVSLAGGAPLPAPAPSQPAPSEPAPPAPTPPSSTEPAPAPPQREPTRPAPPSHPSTPRRGAVPAPDDATMHAQWDAHPRVHGHFSNSFARYSELAPLYAAQGVGDAAEYLDTNMVRLTFFGRHQDGHRDLVAPLRQAEDAMAGQTVSPPITSFGCLVPRPIRGTTNRLSNHALGRAFDLNPTGNPRITQAVDYLVLAAATGTDLHQLRRETDPATLSRISRAFQDSFTEAWASSQTQPDILAALQNRGTRERLNGYARHGICTLYVPLIQALIAAGLVWGGAWPSSRTSCISSFGDRTS